MNLKTHHIIHQPHLLNLKLFLIISCQSRHKHRLHQLKDHHQVRSLHFCVNIDNLFHLLLKILLSLFSLFEIPISLIPSSGIEDSFTVHSYPRSTHPIGDQGSISSMTATNSLDLPYHTLRKTSKPPTPDFYNYPLILDN